jgi:hypothetical protein
MRRRADLCAALFHPVTQRTQLTHQAYRLVSPPYMRRVCQVFAAAARRYRNRPSVVGLREMVRITLYPVGSRRSLHPYPTCSGKVARPRRTGPIFLTA